MPNKNTFFCVPNQKPMITLTNAHGNYLRPIEKIFLSSCSEKPRLQLYKISSNYLSRLRRSNKWMMRQNLCHTLYILQLLIPNFLLSSHSMHQRRQTGGPNPILERRKWCSLFHCAEEEASFFRKPSVRLRIPLSISQHKKLMFYILHRHLPSLYWSSSVYWQEWFTYSWSSCKALSNDITFVVIGDELFKKPVLDRAPKLASRNAFPFSSQPHGDWRRSVAADALTAARI